MTVRKPRSRLGTVLVGIGLVAGSLALVPTPPAAAHGSRHDHGPSDGPTRGPLVAGTGSYVDGTFVWTDYVFDDRGPNLVDFPLLGPVRCQTPGGPDCSGGDATYPDFAAPGNTADLVQLQIGARGHDKLALRAVLSSLVDPAVPALGVAFDTDANPATGAATVPGGRWPAVDPLGIDVLVLTTDAGSELWRFDDGAWEQVPSRRRPVASAIDPEDNTIDVKLDRRALPRIRGNWRAFGLVGVRNAAGGTWFDGSEEIFDLAFVGDEPTALWQDAQQGDILAGARVPTNDGLTSTRAAAVVDWRKVFRRTTELADATSPGFHTYLYRSELDLPEGRTDPNPDVSTQHEYLGPYQPYLVFIPEQLPAGNPMTVWLHGANNNHLQSIFEQGFYVGTARAGSPDWYLVPMFQADAMIQASLPATIQISVLGRGETLGYQGISEIDVFEATEDAVRRLDIDRDRITLSGASMGGIGTYRLATLYPDRWAAAIPAIGSGAAMRPLFANLRNVPVRQLNGRLDNGALGPPSEQDAVTLDALGYDHRYWLANDRGHEIPGYYQCVFAQTATQKVRDEHPHEVVYRVDPALFQEDPSRDVSIRYDRAYWVSGIRVHGAGPGQVTARSLAIPHTEETLERSQVTGENQTAGRDLCGPNPSFAPGWSPVHPAGESWLERSLVRIPGAPQPRANELEAELAGIAAVTFDLRRARLDRDDDVTVRITTDAPVEVTLTGVGWGTRVELDDRHAGWARDGHVRVDVPAGSHVITLDR